MAWIRRAGAVAALVCLSACTAKPSTTTTTTSVDPSGGVHTVTVKATPTPTRTPTPKPKVDFIRPTQFGQLEWDDALHGDAKIKLAGGKADADGRSYALGNQGITFADADGDTLEDALVPLVVTGSDGVARTYLYIWRWDKQAQKAVEVADPVAEYGGCTNSFGSAAPGDPTGFQITEYIRDTYDNQACSATPAHKFTRTVAVAGGGLVMTKPTLAYGGICYQTYRDTSDLESAEPIRVAPTASAAVAQQAQHLYMTIPDNLRGRTWPDGWRQVGWLTPELKQQGYFWGICGFYWEK